MSQHLFTKCTYQYICSLCGCAAPERSKPSIFRLRYDTCPKCGSKKDKPERIPWRKKVNKWVLEHYAGSYKFVLVKEPLIDKVMEELSKIGPDVEN